MTALWVPPSLLIAQGVLAQVVVKLPCERGGWTVHLKCLFIFFKQCQLPDLIHNTSIPGCWSPSAGRAGLYGLAMALQWPRLLVAEAATSGAGWCWGWGRPVSRVAVSKGSQAWGAWPLKQQSCKGGGGPFGTLLCCCRHLWPRGKRPWPPMLSAPPFLTPTLCFSIGNLSTGSGSCLWIWLRFSARDEAIN